MDSKLRASAEWLRPRDAAGGSHRPRCLGWLPPLSLPLLSDGCVKPGHHFLKEPDMQTCSSATVTVSKVRSYALVKELIESRVTQTRVAEPWRHAGDIAADVLRSSPGAWRVYRAAIAAGLPSEFQRSSSAKTSATWRAVEREARAEVGASDHPLTLRQAVIIVTHTRRRRRPHHVRT